MRYSKWVVLTLVALGIAFLFGNVPALGGHEKPTEIHGVITATVLIMEDSKLTGDVTCNQSTGPCIRFGRPNIKLSLNGFTMTGTAHDPTPLANCATDFADRDGIQSTFDEVQIEGPGLVQRMRRHGIALVGTSADPVEKAQVKKLVSHQNCFSGIFMGSVNNTLVEEVVSARNSAASAFRPCGGVCVTNSNNNRVRRSEFSGNGSIALGTPPTFDEIPNDFGVGLVGSSSGNIIEENGMGGNINGLALLRLGAATPTENLIKKNVIVGNPPMEVSADNPGINPVGADIRDFSVPGSNTFEENLCITYTGGHTPSPCPSIPQYAGHQNN
jgi:hypothetical protein